MPERFGQAENAIGVTDSVSGRTLVLLILLLLTTLLVLLILLAPLTHFSLSIHTPHTPLKNGSNCVGHPTPSMWMATYTHLAPKTLDQWRKHHKMQTLSAVSCQPSAVSCRSFRTRGHAFGAFPPLQKHHYLHGFCTTDTTSATTTTTHPITMYHTHAPLHMFHHNIYQAPAMYQICHHHL